MILNSYVLYRIFRGSTSDIIQSQAKCTHVLRYIFLFPTRRMRWLFSLLFVALEILSSMSFGRRMSYTFFFEISWICDFILRHLYVEYCRENADAVGFSRCLLQYNFGDRIVSSLCERDKKLLLGSIELFFLRENRL